MLNKNLYKIITILFVAIFAIQLSVASSPIAIPVVECKPGQMVGDLNNDGVIDSLDVVLMADIISGKIDRPRDLCCVDLTRDNRITERDLEMLRDLFMSGNPNPKYCEYDETTISTIGITVLNQNNNPVNEAKIQIFDVDNQGEGLNLIKRGITNSAGLIRFQLDKGRYVIEVTKNGFSTAKNIVLEENEHKRIEIIIEEYKISISTLGLSIKNQNNNPVNQARIQIFDVDTQGEGLNLIKRGITNSAGLIRFQLDKGRYVIEVTKNGFSTAKNIVLEENQNKRVEIIVEEEIDQIRNPRVQILVEDINQNPLSYASISILDLNNNIIQRELTNEEGIIRLYNLDPGRHNLRVFKSGFNEKEKIITLRENQIEEIKISLEEIDNNIKKIEHITEINPGRIRINPGSGNIEIFEEDVFIEYRESDLEKGINLNVVSQGRSRNVKITTKEEDLKTFIKDNGDSASTRLTLSTESDRLFVERGNVEREIKILPTQASERAREVLREIHGEIELKETRGSIMYEVEGRRDVRVLGFIPVNARYQIGINAETGEIEELKKPWFDFISRR
ncbi:MAG: carboxypeptidase regulatory-like domain-containing protein [Candidatus Woesearchaeota archaeon]